jgi:Zn-dependent metalloprotease
MARGITVKVAKAKVVKALQDKLANDKKVVANNEKIREAHKVALDKYQKSILKEFAKDLTIDSVSTRWNGQLEVTYKVAKGVELPKQPEMEGIENELGRYEIPEIENAIRILEMSDEEFVNAATMKQIASYL